MKKTMVSNACLAFLTLLVFGGCASALQQEIDAADYGTLPSSYEADIKNLMSKRLIDPNSAIYTFYPARKGLGQDGLLMGGTKHYGYIVPVDINAKNRYGAYTGTGKFYFLFTPNGRFLECTSDLGQMVRFVD